MRMEGGGRTWLSCFIGACPEGLQRDVCLCVCPLGPTQHVSLVHQSADGAAPLLPRPEGSATTRTSAPGLGTQSQGCLVLFLYMAADRVSPVRGCRGACSDGLYMYETGELHDRQGSEICCWERRLTEPLGRATWPCPPKRAIVCSSTASNVPFTDKQKFTKICCNICLNVHHGIVCTGKTLGSQVSIGRDCAGQLWVRAHLPAHLGYCTWPALLEYRPDSPSGAPSRHFSRAASANCIVSGTTSLQL